MVGRLYPDSGIIENTGTPFDFEAPYWSGDHAVDDDDDNDEHPIPFHPPEAALRAFFGFTYEGTYLDDDPVPENVVLDGFRAIPR